MCVVEVWQHLEDVDDKDANRTVAINAHLSKLTVGQFGFFLVLATHSDANIGKLQASCFCERINSVGKIILDPRSLRMSKTIVEERVLLRMNKEWMRHMQKHYPECTADIIQVLLRSNMLLQQDGVDDDGSENE